MKAFSVLLGFGCGGNRPDFHLFIDEFHNFTTDSFAAVLAEARKYRLCLTLAHQYLDQLSPMVRTSVLGNVGTTISFRLGATDAEVFANEFGKTYLPSQFTELDRFELFIRLMESGVTSLPFRAQSMAPLTERYDRRHRLVQRSRERFSTSRIAVEFALASHLSASANA